MKQISLAIAFEIITAIGFSNGSKCKLYNQLSESEIKSFDDDGGSNIEYDSKLVYYADWIMTTSNH